MNDTATQNTMNPLSIPHTRSGIGFDVHAFETAEQTKKQNRPLMLFGVHVDHDRALKGHSDADVGLHALTDAIYGICAAGDIGFHFPPSDPKHKDQNSADFLNHALQLLKKHGGILTHIDLILMGEEPKMTPYRTTIIQQLSKLTALQPSSIGFKATTTERLGFTGRKEGLACHAIANAIFPEGFKA